MCVCVHQNVSLSLTAVALIPLRGGEGRGGGGGCWQLNLACWFQKEFKRTEMWRGRVLLSAAHRRTISCSPTHTRSPQRGLYSSIVVHLVTPPPQHMFICHFSLFGARCLHYFPHVPGPNDFLYLTVTNWHANFSNIRALNTPHPLISSLWFLHFADLGQTPHIYLCKKKKEGRWAAQITWPLYLNSRLSKGIVSLQTAPCNFHHSWADKPHKGGGGGM